MITDLLAVEDWFLAGAGFGMAAGYLLAEGLLLKPRAILLMSSTYVGFNAWVVNARLQDRRATRYGIVALVIGFACQVVGFVVSLGFQLSPASPSWPRAVAGAGCAAVAAVVVLLAHRLLAPVWYRGGYRRAGIEIASYDDNGERQDRPNGDALFALGRETWPPMEGESHSSYARRVWHVDAVR